MKWPFTHKKQQNPYTILAIISIAVVAMVISLWIGIQQSVWFDEAYSVLVAKQNPAEIIQLAGADVHPPAYYLLLHAWGDAFGWEDLSLRLLSVIAFGGSIMFAGKLVRRLFGDGAAITAVALVALSPLLMRYGFEIRMYSLASFIGVLATYVMVRARERSKHAAWLWGVYAVLVTLGVLTLYHIALLWVAHVAWLAYIDRAKLRQFWRLPWVRAYLGAVLLFLPWAPKFISQLGNGALANIGQPMNIEQLLGVLSFNLFYKPLWQVGVIETLVLLGLIIAGVRAWIHVYRRQADREPLLLLVAYIAVPVIIFMVVSFLRPVYVERYLSQVALGLMALAGVLLARATVPLKPMRRLAVCGMFGAALLAGIYNLAAVGNFNFQRMQKPAVVLAADVIDCTGATVVAADPYVATELSYYLPTTCDLRFYSEQQTLGGGYAPFSNSPLRLGVKNIPLLTNKLFYAYYDEPKLEVSPAYQQVRKHESGGLTVVVYEAQ